jgi:hypothetical protein
MEDDNKVNQDENVPVELRAAGLMVPEPSMISAPMPLSGADTDCDALYMASLVWIGWRWGF